MTTHFYAKERLIKLLPSPLNSIRKLQGNKVWQLCDRIIFLLKKDTPFYKLYGCQHD